MLRWVISCLALATALAAAPALADPTPASSGAPAAGPSVAPEGSPAPAESAGPAAPSEPVPAPSVDQAVTVRAIDWLHRLQTGDVDRTQLTLAFNKVLTPDRVQGIVERLRPLGKVTRYAFVGEATSHGVRAYQFSVDFAAAKYIYLFEVDDKDEVAGILLTPPK